MINGFINVLFFLKLRIIAVGIYISGTNEIPEKLNLYINSAL